MLGEVNYRAKGVRLVTGGFGVPTWVCLGLSKSKLSTTTPDSERRAKGRGLKDAEILSQGEEEEKKPAKCPVR